MPTSVSPALLSRINTGIKDSFIRGISRTGAAWQRIAALSQSTNRAEIYPLMGRFAGMREWVGNRVVEDLEASAFQITNKDWEGTLRIPRPDIEDSNLGWTATAAEQLGDAANRLPDKLIFSLIRNGFSGLGYDGKAFFATDHAFGSNKGTTALSAAAYGAARATMMGMVDDSGESLDINPNLLVVPPALGELAMQIVNADIILVGGQPQTNIWKGSAEVLVSARLTDATDWFLFDTSQTVKPLIWQQRKAPQLVAKNSLDDDSVFWRNEFVWGVDMRGNAGYGLPQLAFGSQVAG